MEWNFTLDEAPGVAKALLQQAGNRTVIAFHGEMGAGKTTFIAELCKQLGVKEAVSSPTFSIINVYSLRDGGTVYHLDLYRINSLQEAVEAGVEDCLLSGNLCLVEWPEKADALMDGALHCTLQVMDEGLRKLVINP